MPALSCLLPCGASAKGRCAPPTKQFVLFKKSVKFGSECRSPTSLPSLLGWEQVASRHSISSSSSADCAASFARFETSLEGVSSASVQADSPSGGFSLRRSRFAKPGERRPSSSGRGRVSAVQQPWRRAGRDSPAPEAFATCPSATVPRKG